MTTEELMAKKLKTAQNDYRVSSEVLRILGNVSQFVPEADIATFRRALVTPASRRQAKAAQSVLFWQDKNAVEEWMAHSDHRMPNGDLT